MVSAAATSFAGVFYAFFYNNLFPEQVFSISRSIEIHSRSDHRRRRDVVSSDPRRVCANRPRRGAQLRNGLSRHRTTGRDAGVLWRLPSPRGRRVAGRRLAPAGAPAWREREQEMTTPLLKLSAVSKRFRGLVAVDQVSFAVQLGEIFAVIGPKRRWQDHTLQHDRRRNGPGRRVDHVRRPTNPWICPRMRSAAWAGANISDCAAVSGVERRGQRHHRRAAAPPRCRSRAS